MPQALEHLIAVLGMKLICKQAGIARLDAGPKGIVLAFRANRFAAPEALIAHIAKHQKRMKLRSDQTLFIAAIATNDEERLRLAAAIAGEIMALLPTPDAIAA